MKDRKYVLLICASQIRLCELSFGALIFCCPKIDVASFFHNKPCLLKSNFLSTWDEMGEGLMMVFSHFHLLWTKFTISEFCLLNR